MHTDKVVMKLKEKREIVIGECKQDKSCERIIKKNDQEFCNAYAFPKAKWRIGVCPLATHVDTMQPKETQGKVRVGQQKQKRKNR